jgi:hypothetical protein
MRAAAFYNDKIGGAPDVTKSNGTNTIAAKLTRRVDVRFDTTRLGRCTPASVVGLISGVPR